MPTTIEQHKASLHQPAFSELLPVRDILSDVIIRTTGALVAAYELSGINSYYHNDDGRNRTKLALEALIRSLPERSMRMQVRFEITEGLGDLRERYQQQLRNQNPTLLALDRLRMDTWRKKEQEGYYLRPLLHAYFHWNPTVHHELPGAAFGKAVTKRFSLDSFSLSANRCIQRTAREHDDVLSEFGSILSGVEQTLRATGMGVRRLTDAEIFLEVKRSLNPLVFDRIPLGRPESSLQHRSTREQIVNTNIEHEEETYIRIGGLLYSFITLKDLPDATFPGILRDLVGLDFPITVNTDVMIPDQAAMIKQYKGRLKKMQAAQRDSHGGYRIDVDAQVAQRQLIETLENLISSSLKTCRTSIVIGVRPSQPVQSHRDLAEQERVLSDRRQKVLYTVMQMNGSRGLPEDLAKRRLFIGGLPGMSEENQRENDCLTVHAADLLPVETSWRGTPQSPLILLDTPHRQLVPFSLWDSSFADANMLIMAASGGGKTFMAMLFLLMMARLKPLISILERGDSYRPLVELMGGRCIDVDLEGSITLNPWDLAPGATTPGKDKIAFLKNLTRHMIGDSPNSDTALLDNLLSEAIGRTYKRCAIRHSNPTPTFNDLREELHVSACNGATPASIAANPSTCARPYPAFGGLGGSNFNGISNYDSLQLDLRKRYSYGLTFDVNYAWSHMLDDQDSAGWGSTAGAQVWQIGNNPSSNYGNSNFDIPQALKGTAVYELPFGMGKPFMNNAIADAVLGGWRISGTFIYQDGTPFTVLDSGVNDYSQAGNVFANPTGTSPKSGACPSGARVGTLSCWFNTAAFETPDRKSTRLNSSHLV